MRDNIKRSFEDIPVFRHFTRQKPSMRAFRKLVIADAPVDMPEFHVALKKSLDFFSVFVRDFLDDVVTRDMFEEAIIQSHRLLVESNKHNNAELSAAASEVYEHLRDILDFPKSVATLDKTVPIVENYIRVLKGITDSPNDDAFSDQTKTVIQSRKILVVDDDEIAREIVKCSLVDLDYEIEEAQSGFLALEMLESYQPDLIILDVGLPDLNGFSVLKLIKDWPEKADIPVILLTGKDGIEDYVVGLARGAIDYIVKPVALPELKKRVKDVMANNRLRQNSR